MAILLLGGLIGAVIVVFVYGYNLEKQMLMNRNLKLLNERYTEEIEGLKLSQKVAKKKQEMVIEEIKVTVLDPKPHAIIVAEVVRFLEKDVSQLKGKKTEQVADVHLLLHEMLRRREYIVERKMVEVRIKTVVISRVLHLYVTAEVKPEGSV